MSRGSAARLFWVCLALVAYGSLVPFELRPLALAEAVERFRHIPLLALGPQARADLLANFVLYVPLGALAAAAWGGTRLRLLALWLGLALAAVAVEFVQLWFAPRTVSLNDLLAETAGAAAGLAAWRLWGGRLDGALRALRQGERPALNAAGALYLAAYVLLALFPYDLALSLQELRRHLASGQTGWVAAAACGPRATCGMRLALEAAAAVPLGLWWALRGASPLGAAGRGLALGLALELGQLLLISGTTQGASVAARGLGALAGAWALRPLTRSTFWGTLRYPRRPWLGTLALIAYLALAAWASWWDHGPRLAWTVGLDRLPELRWLPFYYHYYTSEPKALASALLQLGQYLPVGLWAWSRGAGPWGAALAGALAALPVEAGKLWLGGTHPDPTNLLLAALGSLLGLHASRWLGRHLPAHAPRRQAPAPGAAAVGAALALAVAASALGQPGAPVERAVNESLLPTFPAPESLPPPSLPGFRLEHPRLPAPTLEDGLRLRRENPRFLALLRSIQHRNLQAAITLAYLGDPAAQPLDRILERLLALKPSWRGHLQAKPLAVAYDWLHGLWSEDQRRRLRRHLAVSCRYVADYIRRARLSPYNVILYNSPFQALMACAIALYRDDPQGTPLMAFAEDLWKRRVLPVWRQVMAGGGWHEGGEYVGIGIGQAVYQVPAMWRAATGEDLFRTEPELCAFLDFLVYRTRPDGSHFRWGDGAFFHRAVPDRMALALECGHAAAYSLRPPPPRPIPSAWPWGPLADRSLLRDPAALRRLPPVRLFEGIGLLVGRSAWDAEATYLSFKAGDNYWSHTHLDQGAFLIYKGAPLAIDSGLYGPRYGSDHHMNYAYQAIAHNVVTVKDPADTVPAPGRGSRPPRPIANDGGQRRIGSGWGVEPAPLDLAEWTAKREIYHTGRILDRLLDHRGLTAVVADLTAAYTNALSGQGTFSHRTRRVEHWGRLFAWDRIDDVVLVYDRLAATRADLPKRWLLHTLTEPRLLPDGFVVEVPPDPGRRWPGGRLEAHVLLPEARRLETVGGPGREFWVDGRNYPAPGVSPRRLAERQPGAWRVELRPARPTLEDRFLVVMLPTLAGQRPTHRIRRLDRGDALGVEIRGPRRTIRWWFPHDPWRPITVELPSETLRLKSP